MVAGSRSAQLIEWHGERARLDPPVGEAGGLETILSPYPDAPPLSPAFLRYCVDLVGRHGAHALVTSAITTPEADAFLAAGFTVRAELHLLLHELREIPERPAVEGRLHRTRWSSRQRILEVDHAAFGPGWRLDGRSLLGALDATPYRSFRSVSGPGREHAQDDILGYAITGRAGRRGFVQRLAVHPAAHRRGYGRALMVDALRWCRRWRVNAAVVNTQRGNQAALALYEGVGFREAPVGLCVLERRLISERA